MNCCSDINDNRGDFGWLVALIILVLFLCLQSCKTTKYVPVETVRTDSIRIETLRVDTLYISSSRVDSVHIKDSVHITTEPDSVIIRHSGDSVFVTEKKGRQIETHWHSEVKSTEKTDSVYHAVATADSSYLSRDEQTEIPVPVEQKLSFWQKLKSKVNVLLIVVACFGIIAAVVWLIYKKIKK